ncbi:MAG: LTA synthase family protein [Bacteroidaceae bacterium]|nr:LTA synthase family protein [Bacteroidaceae bacterium]
MKKIKTIILLFLLWLAVGIISKPLFLLCNTELLQDASIGDWLAVIGHGLRLDLAVAAYLIILPLLLLFYKFSSKYENKADNGNAGSDKPVVETANDDTDKKSRKERKGQKVWLCLWHGVLGVESFLYVLAIIANLSLYPYWGFPLDTTPLFYLTSSPADAMASITIWQILLSLFFLVLLTIALNYGFNKILKPKALFETDAKLAGWKSYAAEIAALVILGASLIIPIRGGFSTATNNTGSVYFSTQMPLNHAAVNPVFSFIESASKSNKFSEMFRYMDDDEAARTFQSLCYTTLRNIGEGDTKSVEPVSPTDSITPISPIDSICSVSLKQTKDVNVIMVVLEGFSDQIMNKSGRVNDVVPNLEKYTQEGLYFNNFYATSFRTDRGLVSILSAFPSQPEHSLMKYSHKTAHLYSIANSLKQHGYATSYYYGGDANFTNMRSYVMQTGFERLISDTDFPSSQQTGKWGVQDEFLFNRALHDIGTDSKLSFRVIQTSSSHEPFEVPYQSSFKEPELNAFAYVDHCLGEFIESLKALPSWQNTLVILVPDHLGAYPNPIDNYQLYRYQVPMLMLGGVISKAQQIETIGSQVDLAATLLGLLGIDHSEFTYSKDILDANAPHYAVFSCPGLFGMVTDSCSIIYDYNSDKMTTKEGALPEQQLRKAKAYMQTVFDDIDKR